MFVFHVMFRVRHAKMKINIHVRSVQQSSHSSCLGHHTALKVAQGVTSKLQLALLVQLVRLLALIVRVMLEHVLFVTLIVHSQSYTITSASKSVLPDTQLLTGCVKDVRAHARTALALSLIAYRVMALTRGGISILMLAMRNAHLTRHQSQMTSISLVVLPAQTLPASCVTQRILQFASAVLQVSMSMKAYANLHAQVAGKPTRTAQLVSFILSMTWE